MTENKDPKAPEELSEKAAAPEGKVADAELNDVDGGVLSAMR